jgi:uncharacterized protein DUF4440
MLCLRCGDARPGVGMRLRTLRCLRRVALVAVIVSSASCAFAQVNAAREIAEITQLEHKRATAVVHRDLDFLEKITAADSVRILPTGALETKAEFLTKLKSGAVTYSAIDVDQVSVKIYGGTAVVTGRSAAQGQAGGKRFQARWRFSRVWIEKDGGWQEVMFQLTPVQAP